MNLKIDIDVLLSLFLIHYEHKCEIEMMLHFIYIMWGWVKKDFLDSCLIY